MSEFETQLRTMLRGRAADIATLPAHLVEFDTPAPTGRRRQLRTGWLIAAAVVAVLAIVGMLFAIQPGSGHRTPATTHTPTTSHTTTAPAPLPKSGHARRDVSLDWFDVKNLPGYALHMRESAPGYRMLAVRKNSDEGVPIGCNGCESASDYVYVFDKGRFDATKNGVTSWARTTVAGSSGYLGTMDEYGTKRYPVPTLAWEYAPGSWALVQGVTPSGGATTALREVANAVEPTVDVPIRLPFTLRYVPALPIVNVTDDRSEGYAFTIDLGGVSRDFNVTLWPAPNPGVVTRTPDHRRLIGGMTGYYDRQRAVADIPIARWLVELGLSENSGPLTAADRTEMDRIIDGLHWAPEGVPAQTAIP